MVPGTTSKIKYLIFGSETTGLPKPFYQKYKSQLYLLPQKFEAIRSYNLAVSVGMTLGVISAHLHSAGRDPA